MAKNRKAYVQIIRRLGAYSRHKAAKCGKSWHFAALYSQNRQKQAISARLIYILRNFVV